MISITFGQKIKTGKIINEGFINYNKQKTLFELNKDIINKKYGKTLLSTLFIKVSNWVDLISQPHPTYMGVRTDLDLVLDLGVRGPQSKYRGGFRNILNFIRKALAFLLGLFIEAMFKKHSRRHIMTSLHRR